eukprot:2798986-Prymnesium_polylepis.2
MWRTEASPLRLVGTRRRKSGVDARSDSGTGSMTSSRRSIRAQHQDRVALAAALAAVEREVAPGRLNVLAPLSLGDAWAELAAARQRFPRCAGRRHVVHCVDIPLLRYWQFAELAQVASTEGAPLLARHCWALVGQRVVQPFEPQRPVDDVERVREAEVALEQRDVGPHCVERYWLPGDLRRRREHVPHEEDEGPLVVRRCSDVAVEGRLPEELALRATLSEAAGAAASPALHLRQGAHAPSGIAERRRHGVAQKRSYIARRRSDLAQPQPGSFSINQHAGAIGSGEAVGCVIPDAWLVNAEQLHAGMS